MRRRRQPTDPAPYSLLNQLFGLLQSIVNAEEDLVRVSCLDTPEGIALMNGALKRLRRDRLRFQRKAQKVLEYMHDRGAATEAIHLVHAWAGGTLVAWGPWVNLTRSK